MLSADTKDPASSKTAIIVLNVPPIMASLVPAPFRLSSVLLQVGNKLWYEAKETGNSLNRIKVSVKIVNVEAWNESG